MEPSLAREPGRCGFWSRWRALLLAGLSLLILAGVLAALFLPRLLLSPAVKHPPLLKTSSALQGDFAPSWRDEQTLLLFGQQRYQWNLSGNTLRQIPQSSCPWTEDLTSALAGIYSICASDTTGELQVVNILTGVKTLDYNDHLDHSWSNFTLNKGATQIAALSDREVLQVWDLQTGRSQVMLQLPPTSDSRIGLAWSPDGLLLAVHYQQRNLQIWDLGARRLLYSLEGPDVDTDGELAWSADSTHLGYISEEAQTLVDIWDMGTGKLSMTYQPQFGVASALTLRLLASGQSFLLQAASGQFALIEARTRRVLLSQPPSLQPSILQVSPDTQLFALSRGSTIEVYDAATGQKVATYAGLTTQFHFGKVTLSFPMTGSWSPDSNSIASAGQDGRLHVWNARIGQDSASYALQVSYPSEIAWSPGGDMIALVTASAQSGTPDLVSSKPERAYIVSAP